MKGRKLQVFVSSTYKDLQAERAAAVQAILRAGHIPAGMELFVAGDESQWETIKRWIDDCDAFLLLLGERYGSIEPKSGKSYTQLEYEYATERGKRFFALVLNPEWIDKKFGVLCAEASDAHRTEHASFKQTVLSKSSAFVGDEKDIRTEVITSLAEIDQDDTIGGWVRSSEYNASQRLVTQLTRTIDELHTRVQTNIPTAASIHTELNTIVEDLRQMPFDRHIKEKFGDDEESKDFQLRANGLGLLWVNRKLMRGGIDWYPTDVWTLDLIESILPLLQIWGLVTIARGEPKLEPKGVLLMNKVDALTREDVGNPHYANIDD